MDIQIQSNFNDMLERVKRLPSQPNKVLLDLYALYKQATVGDVQGKRPGFTNVRGRAKYDAWVSLKGMNSQDAMGKYITYSKKLGA